MRTYCTEDYEAAAELKAQGLTYQQISDRISIPRETIRKWWGCEGWKPRHSRANAALPEYRERPWLYVTPDREESYAYVLGQYLGDGHIINKTRNWQLWIYSDVDYEGLNLLTMRHLRTLFPQSTVRRKLRPGCWRIEVGNALLPYLFPQMGPGQKWTRKIELAPWQITILDRNPHAFLAGLIYSDGCIYGPPERPIYNFTQKSTDIMGIYQRYCALIGLRIKQPRQGKAALMLDYGHPMDRVIFGAFLKRKADVSEGDSLSVKMPEAA